MFSITMTADMLETGMTVRSQHGSTTTIEVSHKGDDIIVDAGGAVITYPQGQGFLTSYEDESYWGMEPGHEWFMFATDEFGSIAEMPLVAPVEYDARNDAIEWLETYDHNFDHAVLVSAFVQDAWRAESTETIHERIIRLASNGGDLIPA